MADIPTTEPSQIRAGTTVKWDRNDLSADYPADTWTLNYYLINSAGKITITASANGLYFRIAETAATSADYTVGKYEWIAEVNEGTNYHVADRGTIEILTDYSVAETFDSRSDAQYVYEAITAVIKGRASQDQESYSIAGRALSKTPIPDLLLLRDKFKAEWETEKKTERINNGGDSRNRIKVRFQRS